MSGDKHYQSGPDLPAPQSEGFNMPLPNQNSAADQGEKAALQPESQPTSAAGVQAPPAHPQAQTPFVPPPLPIIPSSPATQSTQPSVPTPIPVNSVPDSADDSDLIEREWVSKAKYIVETSRDDPRLQNKEISKLKADYIQKRYNKQLKVSDD